MVAVDVTVFVVGDVRVVSLAWMVIHGVRYNALSPVGIMVTEQ